MIEHAPRGEVDVVLDRRRQLPRDAARRDALARARCARPRLRVHQDIVLSSSMLVEGDGDVLLLPATTRYESPGGGTETSTERRIIFSPEIPGRRIGSAQARVVGVPRGDGARASRARAPGRPRGRRGDPPARSPAPMPLYAGIETLAAKGDQVQWGGRTLYADGRFATADGKAHFAAVSPARRSRGRRRTRFAVSTRRGKQFNSMVQREVDPLTGAGRDDILISADDLARLRLRRGRARAAAVGARHVQRPAAEPRRSSRQPRSALAGGQRAAVGRRDRSRLDGAGLQRRGVTIERASLKNRSSHRSRPVPLNLKRCTLFSNILRTFQNLGLRRSRTPA